MHSLKGANKYHTSKETSRLANFKKKRKTEKKFIKHHLAVTLLGSLFLGFKETFFSFYCRESDEKFNAAFIRLKYDTTANNLLAQRQAARL